MNNILVHLRYSCNRNSTVFPTEISFYHSGMDKFFFVMNNRNCIYIKWTLRFKELAYDSNDPFKNFNYVFRNVL